MVKVRQDAWSHDEDLLLAETVLRHIREGSTQLKAFDEVGDALNRTSAACGFRWNAEIRNKYNQAIQLAKKQRKEYKKAMAQAEMPSSVKADQTIPPVQQHTESQPEELNDTVTFADYSELSLTDVIQFLSKLNENTALDSSVRAENEQLKQNLDKVNKEKEALAQRYSALHEDYQSIQEDYQSFVQMMERARRMTRLDQAPSPGSYQMDEDGNFTQIAK
ncbi:RsfA family transcriptional regulator [Bacillaceae bacterium SIJ1]|uniref:RsfA family transcriptional regulator n=1 Tax=Litoribacterium kuwaitense TaxID=1398745 RepID=UPI0013E9B324|nr:RsfA family transcriptional regulator [Litoribacterium kuwaitense]NGP43448.1 RsfA family transcriptional regulator [Litoribacterium kuwaitense]